MACWHAAGASKGREDELDLLASLYEVSSGAHSWSASAHYVIPVPKSAFTDGDMLKEFWGCPHPAISAYLIATAPSTVVAVRPSALCPASSFVLMLPWIPQPSLALPPLEPFPALG